MKDLKLQTLAGALFVLAATAAFAQPNYPQAPKRPKPSASASSSASPSPSASATDAPSASPSPSATPTGPAKKITTDSDRPNPKSPIKFQSVNCYDSGGGAKFNAEMRLDATVVNSSKTDTLKNVVVKYQLVDLDGQTIQEWVEKPGTLKPGQSFQINPGVARNSLGTKLNGKVVVEHDEVQKKDGNK
ncbi:hypothetical protein JST97_02075 [bacterium]|nr:hypothetical protein [bacterium]